MKRVLTGALLTIVIGVLSVVRGWPLRCGILILSLAGMHEVYGAFRRKGFRPVRSAGWLLCLLGTCCAAFADKLTHPVFKGLPPLLLCLIVSFIYAAFVVVARGKCDYESLGATAFTLIYPGLFFVTLQYVQDVKGELSSVVACLLTFLIASSSDVCAYFIGCRFGKHRLSPEISPKKSVEGSIAGIAGAVLCSVLVPVIVSLLRGSLSETMRQEALPPLWAFALLGLVIGAVSQLGDLTASLVKRYCGIKDYGTILPGHGGVMDRFDGILFTGCVCYAFFMIAGK